MSAPAERIDLTLAPRHLWVRATYPEVVRAFRAHHAATAPRDRRIRRALLADQIRDLTACITLLAPHVATALARASYNGYVAQRSVYYAEQDALA